MIEHGFGVRSSSIQPTLSKWIQAVSKSNKACVGHASAVPIKL